MSSVELSKEEARLVAMHRAVERFDDHSLLPSDDVSTLSMYFEVLANTDQLESAYSSTEIERYLDGFVAGFAANRLAAAGLRPDKAVNGASGQYQTGVDPVTEDVRVNT